MVDRPQTPAQNLSRGRARIADEISASVRRYAEELPPLSEEEKFGSTFDRFGAARIVLLGEATHGTAEFYVARANITRRLIEEHGFNIVAVEADWPDAARVDAYVRHRDTGPHLEEVFTRFPQWMWRNEQVAAFVEWLRLRNRDRPHPQRVSFRGLDIYSLRASIAAVLKYLDQNDPAKAAEARQRYSCLTPWQNDPAHYGRGVMTGEADLCEQPVTDQLMDLLTTRLDEMAKDDEEFFHALQNARVVRSAEHYYRLMYRSSVESWNLRDRHMFETLQLLMRPPRKRDAPQPKAVVWAHNSHIGNAAATAMGWQGEFNIGELCRTAYGLDAILIGFGTDRGKVAAASDWDAPMQISEVRPAREDSYEHAFRRAGKPRSLTDWRTASSAELTMNLSESLLERAIGVIYRPETELMSHYFECVLAEQFDAYVWFEETSAVTPIESPRRKEGVPDTYPFGL